MKIIKSLFAVLFFFALSVTAFVPADMSVAMAAGQQQGWDAPKKIKKLPANVDALVYVENGLNVISAEKRAELEKKLETLNAKYDVHAGIYIVKNLPPGAQNIEEEARRFAESGSYNNGTNGSIVLYITMSDRKYYVATGNYMNRRITSNEGVRYICEQIVPELKDNNFAGAAELFVENVDKELAYFAEEGKPYDPADEFDWLSFVCALVGAVTVGFCVRFGLICLMGNVKHEECADAYLERDTFELTEEEDTYLYTTTTIVKRSKGKDEDSGFFSSGSRGSSGGGGGSF